MITIGIPTYERTTYIAGALESCLRQNYSNFEILINDTSSHDRIQDLAASYGSDKIRYIRNASGMAVTPKLNQLLAEARGDWMLILCDDDLLEPDYLKAMAAKIKSFPAATLYRCRYKIIDTQGGLLRLDREANEFMSPAEFLSRVFLPERFFFKMNISGILFPRRLLQLIGGFPDLSVPWHTDRLTWSLLASEGGCAYEKKPLCSVRLHPASLTSSFNSYLTSSLESDMTAKRIFEETLERVERRALNEEDRLHLFAARRNLESYMQRHLSRSLDHGFISQLSQEQSRSGVEQLYSLFEKMKEVRVSNFRSLPLYCALSFLPFPLRQPLLEQFKNYKIKKWCV
jgi:hypothetical protein